ncbi:MAG: tRNA ((37)-C2)-methylthiotransferase MiaB [Peptococcaceae bacterium]|jgi:tRNA-2-methylthio-N6-dimethylallyladenosine synthase|uniref:tRNA-2-methylthio-N(6)-dimethylallyladenosine synthase n=1 Tax=Thermanaerosceptrum fracticalcis TaxID=1712410 RepID=A0A7G6E0P9_THEFR|nr:tRNA (N6-isopentenyl adenosine(37)-C2)-methylthiotransferase MiaB [Thermanaerosceptrum fracticalcis]MBZ4653682.1 tRNA ((37)-C2)-methylthiotransferase MiaB [Peptococcaceae bacterium]QNB45653.1 tRNA (N6-isopentenyl adenosine(37)-C2)-methylthiotransferase MiaB [Thermanaerosceptrum fracticalcis]
MKYHLVTFGCQANERDSETIAGLLREIGYERVEEPTQADLILFNTCCVREKAENKVLSRIGELKDLKSQNPHLIIGICGCMVQQEKIVEKIRRRAPHVDLIFGTHNIHELPELVQSIKNLRVPQVHILPDREEIVEGLPSHREFPFKALVNITYGCNNFCTYCIVPYVRGREKSRLPEHILKEISAMSEDGVLEVMLLGQNVNSYGKDLTPPTTFAELLQQVNAIPGLARIRYMTSHPRDFSDELISTIAGLNKVSRHFHLPVQAGSNDILRKMNRGYTREEYLTLVRKIKNTFPEASITTDIIVGFPGESEEDFEDTLKLVEEVRFDSAFTFIYSPRTGTPAAKMPEQIAESVKKSRLQRLMKLQNRISLEINQQLKGKVMEVLVEGESKTSPEMLTGRTDTNKTVIFPGPLSLTGKLVPVKITVPQTWILKGELVEVI